MKLQKEVEISACQYAFKKNALTLALARADQFRKDGLIVTQIDV
jgi:hypothetical protein